MVFMYVHIVVYKLRYRVCVRPTAEYDLYIYNNSFRYPLVQIVCIYFQVWQVQWRWLCNVWCPFVVSGSTRLWRTSPSTALVHPQGNWSTTVSGCVGWSVWGMWVHAHAHTHACTYACMHARTTHCSSFSSARSAPIIVWKCIMHPCPPQRCTTRMWLD